MSGFWIVLNGNEIELLETRELTVAGLAQGR